VANWLRDTNLLNASMS